MSQDGHFSKYPRGLQAREHSQAELFVFEYHRGCVGESFPLRSNEDATGVYRTKVRRASSHRFNYRSLERHAMVDLIKLEKDQLVMTGDYG